MFSPIISVVLCIDQAGHGTRENTCYKQLQHAAYKLERKVLYVSNQLDVMIYYVIVKFNSQRFSMVMFSSHTDMRLTLYCKKKQCVDACRQL